MTHFRLLLVVFTCLLFGCAPQRFLLSDESAVSKLLTTKHVADLQRTHEAPLTAWVESVRPDARYLYLGESHPDHTVRVGAYRVTSDGRVWMNADPTLLEDRWVAIE
jgi:hypothetical protein